MQKFLSAYTLLKYMKFECIVAIMKNCSVQVLPGSTPLSHRYGGHQFGYWAGQLGDGRAHMLGEYVSHEGQRWELQLKVSI